MRSREKPKGNQSKQHMKDSKPQQTKGIPNTPEVLGLAILTPK